MAHSINDECIACGVCEAECPVSAIAEGDPYYTIDASKCTDCAGEADGPHCESVCPTDACAAA